MSLGFGKKRCFCIKLSVCYASMADTKFAYQLRLKVIFNGSSQVSTEQDSKKTPSLRAFR